MLINEITDQECGTPFLDSIGHELQCNIYIGASALRLKTYDFTDNKQNMLFTLFGWDKFFNLITEKYNTYLVIILDRRESKSRGYFSHSLLLYFSTGTEIAASAHIHKKHNRKLTLLLINLDIRFILSRSHVPVNIADIITRLIFPHL